MEERDEQYCTLCQGRGLDRYDRLCPKCLGTGLEHDTVDSRRILIRDGYKDVHSRPYRR